MNLKHVTVAGLAALALVACGGPAAQSPTAAPAVTSGATEATTAPASGAASGTAVGTTSGDPSQVVVRLNEITLTRGELDDRIKRIQTGIAAQGSAAGQTPQDIEIEKSLVELFVNEVLTLNVANDRSVAVSDAEVDNQIKQIGDNIAAQGGTIEQAITNQLGYENAQAPQFRMLISSIVAREKITQTLVPTDTVEAELRTSLEAEGKQEVEKADVRHILVATEDEAKKAIERLNKGEKFEDLAKELSTDPGSKDNGGLYEGVEKGTFVAEFDKATFEDLQPGETTKEPVKTQFGYHVIKLEKREKSPRYTAEQINQKVTEQLDQQLLQRRGEEFQKLVDAAREKAVAASQFVEPSYPEPTPAAPGALPENISPAETPGAEAPADATAAP